MKYKLKDRARQEALEKALSGFAKRFQSECRFQEDE